MTPHVAAARKAATLLLWAACGGASVTEACELMQVGNDLWPDPPLMLGKDGPLGDSPSARAWTNAAAALEAARVAQETLLGIDREKQTAAEALIDNFKREVAP